MDIKIVYIFPLKLVMKDNDFIVSDIMRLSYSILSMVSNVSDKITIYCDFDGAYIFSTLFPTNVKIIFSNSIEGFNRKVINEQKNPYIIVRNNEILKSSMAFNGDYLIKENNEYTINPESIKADVTDTYISDSLNRFYGTIYDKFVSGIENKLHQLKAVRLVNNGEGETISREYFPAPVAYPPIGIGNLL